MTATLRSHCAGFTLLEMVTIIVIVGILSLLVTARFGTSDSFDSRGFYDKATATVRFAQKTAVAWRRPVYVCVTATQVAVGTASGCATPITNPVTNQLAVETAPAGVTLNAVEFSFDGLGRPNAAATITFTSTIAGDPARQITVAAETGYVTAN
jgi:MSHA pilin protein MshC